MMPVGNIRSLNSGNRMKTFLIWGHAISLFLGAALFAYSYFFVTNTTETSALSLTLSFTVATCSGFSFFAGLALMVIQSKECIILAVSTIIALLLLILAI